MGLQTLLIKNARPILGYKSYKWSSLKILDTLKWVSVSQLIISESLKFYHRINFENIPYSMTRNFTYSINRSQNVRNVRKPMLIYKPNTQKMSQSILFKTIFSFTTNFQMKSEF